MGLLDRAIKAEDERDFIRRIPGTKQELTDFIKESGNIKDFLQKNPDKTEALYRIVNDTYDKYQQYLGHGLSHKAHLAGKTAGYAADVWGFCIADPIGSFGGKVLYAAAQIPDKAYGLIYGLKTGNYIDALKNVAGGLVGCLPGLTLADQGLNRIVRKRMLSDAKTKLEKEFGLYKSWTSRLADKLKNTYKGVVDRAKNVFSPGYEPKPEPVPA